MHGGTHQRETSQKMLKIAKIAKYFAHWFICRIHACLRRGSDIRGYAAIITVSHNERDGVSNHRCLCWLLNRLFRRRSQKTSNFRVTGLCEGNHWWPVESPHKGPVTRKMFPFDDVIVIYFGCIMVKFSKKKTSQLTPHSSPVETL